MNGWILTQNERQEPRLVETFKNSDDKYSTFVTVLIPTGTAHEGKDRISRLHLESNGSFARIPDPGTFTLSTHTLSVLTQTSITKMNVWIKI